jgi:hypothetical protein
MYKLLIERSFFQGSEILKITAYSIKVKYLGGGVVLNSAVETFLDIKYDGKQCYVLG